MVLTMKICRDCGAANIDETECMECNSTNFALVDELICMPAVGEAHIQIDRELAMMLKKFVGKKCKVRIEEV